MITATGGALWLATAMPAQAVIQFGQIDDFQDLSTAGWVEGFVSPNPPTNEPGGPMGAGDRHLRNVSSGGFGAGSRMIMFNRDQWTGNYNTVGVTRITADLANFGTTPLHMRVAMQGGIFRFASTNAFTLPADGVWRQTTFILSPSNMSNIGSGGSVGEMLESVLEVRLLSAEIAPAWIGDPIVGTLGVDNIRATRLSGDANFDGTVNLSDFNALAANFNQSGMGIGWSMGDFNFDQTVNLADFNLLAGNFNTTESATPGAAALGAAVPEPAAISLACGASALLLRRRRPRQLS